MKAMLRMMLNINALQEVRAPLWRHAFLVMS